MRTTLDIEDDVLAAARELAHRQGTSAGKMVSRLLRAALLAEVQLAQDAETGPAEVAGFRPFAAADQKLVTNEQIDLLRDREGLCCGPCSTST